MAKNREMVNGAEREMIFGRRYCVGDTVERWWIDGEGGNSTVRYSAIHATRSAAKNALANSEFPLCPLGDGNPIVTPDRIAFTTARAIPYYMIGKRLTVSTVDTHGRMTSWSEDVIEVVRICDGELRDRSGLITVE